MVSFNGVDIFSFDPSGVILTLLVIGLIIIGIAIFGAILYVMTFNISVTQINIEGDGRKGYSVSKVTTNRAKWNKHRTFIKFLYPLFSGRQHTPTKANQVYDNKMIYFKFNNMFVPGEISLLDISGKPVIIPDLAALNEANILIQKENAKEFTEHDFWNDNKTLIIGLIACICCLALCGLTIYFAFDFATGGTSAINNLADKINNLGVVQSVPG